ncbi:flagellar hook-basal body complex protein [Sphingomonas sp. LaA6.9]|uniref:flagellar hook-basal body complex protein n=1 Tax=Sphingomonas sp. LaA6.9 TaxID=2919914 RepID=UPI001F500BE9|nr:flagellar hook-basal body complex protein [Sphingomonas sp. LaA6.9]MCJ8157710.1 flagellar hook-basal body complex protein [Sphingomonas sp. LaA6.9]
MDVSTYVLLSHEQALRRRLDVTANNMANSNTVGFKREQPLFHEYVEQTKEAPVEDAKKTSYVLDYGAVHDTSQGAFQATGNPLDVMIDGPGYLNVETAEGGVAYTRAGFIKILETGELATSGGQRILGANGRPIVVPADQKATVTIASDGTVMTRTGEVGRIAVTSFADENMVSPRGDGMMTGTGGTALTQVQTRLRIGGIEASNVQPIVETTAMVEILRSYQTSQRMSESLSEMRKSAIGRLGRIN